MLVTVSREGLQDMLEQDIRSWHLVAGGPNMDAFKFDAETQDPAELKRLGYFDNPSAWIAGVQIKTLHAYVMELEDAPLA